MGMARVFEPASHGHRSPGKAVSQETYYWCIGMLGAVDRGQGAALRCSLAASADALLS